MAKRTRRPRLPRPPAVRDVTEALRRQDALADELTEEVADEPRRTAAPPRAGVLALPPGPADDSERLQAWLERAARGEPQPARARREPTPVPPDRGRFWEDFRVAWTKLVVVRLVFFGLLAADAFLQVAHAARYGAGGFNVPQLAWLPLGAPHRLAMIAIHAGLGLAFALIAQGVLVRRLLPVATALYAYAYLVSQLDSYQHHYLVALVLLLWCFVPDRPEPRTGAAAQRPASVRSWALRLVLVQLAIVYLWAAYAKIDPAWFDGTALRSQVANGWVRDLVGDVGFDTVAVLVVLAELALAGTVWLRRAWWIALPLGVGLHAGIELVGLEIGLFSYLMMALYLLLVPDRVFHALDRAIRRSIEVARRPQLAWLVGGALAALAATIGFLAIPLPSLRWPLAVTGVVVGAMAGRALRYRDRGRAGRLFAAFAVALTLPVVLAHTTDTVLDHHRYRAGAARRLGDTATARAAYRDMLAVDPSSEYAHYYLGGLDADAGAVDAALAHYHAAQRAAPLRARSFVAEARLVFARGELARAQALLRDALAADPTDLDARALETSWTTLTPAEGADPKVPPSAPPRPPTPGPAVPAEAPLIDAAGGAGGR